jgi:ribosome-associated protein
MINHSAEELCQVVVEGLQELKGEDICIIDLREIHNAFTDYFVIASGNSDTHNDSLAESVEKEVHNKYKLHPSTREGKIQKEWILLDFTDVVVHIFKKDRREFYALEELWADAKITHLKD